MAQASFFVNHVKIIQAEDGFIIEGQRTCMGGSTMDRVHVLMPNDLKAAFKEWLEDELARPASSTTHEPSAWAKGRFSKN